MALGNSTVLSTKINNVSAYHLTAGVQQTNQIPSGFFTDYFIRETLKRFFFLSTK